MTRNELQQMRYRVRELEEMFQETQECGKIACNACPYNDICEVTNTLYRLILYKLSRYNAKRGLKDDND